MCFISITDRKERIDLLGHENGWPRKRPRLKLVLCFALFFIFGLLLGPLLKRDAAAKPIQQDAIREESILCEQKPPYSATFDSLDADEAHVLIGSETGYLRLMEHDGDTVIVFQTAYDEFCLNEGLLYVRLDQMVGVYQKDGSFVRSEAYIPDAAYHFATVIQCVQGDKVFSIEKEENASLLFVEEDGVKEIIAKQEHYQLRGLKIAVVVGMFACMAFVFLFSFINGFLLRGGQSTIKYAMKNETYRQATLPFTMEHKPVDFSKLEKVDSNDTTVSNE